jgi:beta-mannanase
MLSFAPEANGNWYRWGWSHTPPAVWVAAWRHVVTLFRSLKARNAIWVWTVNISFPHSGPVANTTDLRRVDFDELVTWDFALV